ncbi:MAG: efflux RND transporter periplasmic adaptor subunit [Thiomicrospira sp.]|uniref:efflux RND transporter periplasmic adaptor subunit n=1 Tax=Thiomicrospira sp. TaxID=935 RepID=UPI001A02DD50|nr:efflux RND transporter periplasmic adaptor subunit [Thiomicrospira sp.]MBE0492884.1 efflux RND transporter periplasmic adaptor subunit [Thiomicrospira sp.]
MRLSLTGLMLGLLLGSFGLTSQASQTQSVVSAKVFEKQIVETIQALGDLNASESVDISASVTEQVESIHFNDGDYVKKDQLLVQLRSAEERASLAELKIATNNAKQLYDRYLPLYTRGDIAQSTLDEYKREWDLARAKEAVLQARLEKLTLKAPFAGRVSIRQISEGALLTPGTKVTELQDLTQVKIDFSVPSRFLTELSVGDRVVTKTDAYVGQDFIAQIETILPRVDVKTRSVQVRAKLTNPDGLLVPGMLMKVELQQKPRSVLFIPETAIVPIAEHHYVYQLMPEANGLYKISRKQVALGMRQPGLVEIKTGLELGDKVVSEGALRVRPGQVVNAMDKLPVQSSSGLEDVAL